MIPSDPFVRVVIVNYSGGDLTLRCIASVKASEWPSDRLEIVVVDNASRDGSAEAVEREHPDVRLLRAPRNLGYPAANNLALLDLEGVDYITLLNNDAVVGQKWLRPLVSALEADPTLGAVVPKILFETVFDELALTTPVSSPLRGDRRRLGIRLSGIRVDGRDRWREAQFPDGWHYAEYGSDIASPFRWSHGHAQLRVPRPDEGPASVELLLAADREKTVAVMSGELSSRIQVGPTPTWIAIPLSGEPLNIVNSVGSVLLSGGYGADRGMLEADRGQYEQPAEVFAWCGCNVLLRQAYLEDVGLLEPKFFLYYEDLDLSWRGRARGWRYSYVPAATVRHRHAASTVEGSSVFHHYVERNRLLVHARNAPARYALRVGGRFVWELLRQVRLDVVLPALQLRRPRLVFVFWRLRSLVAFVWHLPPTLRTRRHLRRRQSVSDEDLLRWLDVR